MKLRIVLLTLAMMLFSVQAWAEMRSVRVKTANFRDAPEPNADVLFTADQNYPVEVLERRRGWAKVKDFEGEVAWVAERLLHRQSAIVITVERVVVRDKPAADGKVVFRAEWSDAFAVKRQQAGWVLIEGNDGKQGWVTRDSTWGLKP